LLGGLRSPKAGGYAIAFNCQRGYQVFGVQVAWHDWQLRCPNDGGVAASKSDRGYANYVKISLSTFVPTRLAEAGQAKR
jgi:hypothetical protein